MNNEHRVRCECNGAKAETTVPHHGRLFSTVLGVVLPIAVIAAAAYGAYELLRTAPKAERRPAKRVATAVEIRNVHAAQEQIHITAMGTVIPAREVTLQPLVSGELIRVSKNLVPGGRVVAGEQLVQIDPRDYELAIEEAQSGIAQAEYELKLEQGYQEIAKREWELLGDEANADSLDKELALRKPHLAKALAAVLAARASLDKAKLALERTTIRAPFNGIITSKSVDTGARVTTQTQIATLVGTDEYWVQVALPTEQVRWVDYGEENRDKGSAVEIRQHLSADIAVTWTGTVSRLLGDLEDEGRMARLLVTVTNPLGGRAESSDEYPLLIGAYVEVEITGPSLPAVVKLARHELRNGDTVWIMRNGVLDIQPVDIVFGNRNHVFVRNSIGQGDQLVTSDLPAAVLGMPLRLLSDAPLPQGQHTGKAAGADLKGGNE